MSEVLQFIISTYGLEMIGLILCGIFCWAGKTAKKFWQDKMDTQTKRDVAYDVFHFVEQVWKTLKGEQKMQKALEVAQSLLAKKGIQWDAEEMRVLIEVCCQEFNTAFKAPLDSENAEANYDVPDTVIADTPNTTVNAV